MAGDNISTGGAPLDAAGIIARTFIRDQPLKAFECLPQIGHLAADVNAVPYGHWGHHLDEALRSSELEGQVVIFGIYEIFCKAVARFEGCL
jgi:hypothetical protein